MDGVVTIAWDDATCHVASATGAFRSGDVTVLGDVRLDAEAELAARLGCAEERGLALVARAHARWGHAFAEHLVGDYAVVIVVAGARKVLAARDPFGVRRLAYRRLPNAVAFARDVGALAALGTPSAEIDEGEVLALLAGTQGSHVRTCFRTVSRVPAGHTLVVGPSRVDVRRHFFPPADERTGSREDTLEAFRAAFERSVRDRLRATRAVVVEVSGGLDSSSIACVADSLGGQPVHYYHARYREADERRFVAALGARLSLPIHVHDADPTSALDEPINPGEPDGYPLFAGATGRDSLVATTGARAVLSGIGGDELLFERGVYRDLAAAGAWATLWREAGLARRYSTHSRRFFVRDALRSLAPRPTGWPLAMARRLRRERRPAWLRKSAPVMQPDVAPLAWDWRSETQRFNWEWLTSPNLTATLEAEDRASALAGVELRYPFLDTRLANVVLATPYAHRLPAGRMKVLLRDALRDVLPERIRERDVVTTFDGAIVAAIRSKLPALGETIERGPWRSDTWVARPAATALLRRVAAGAADRDELIALWKIAMLERWLRAIG